jgi:hypothetical protein
VARATGIRMAGQAGGRQQFSHLFKYSLNHPISRARKSF